MNDESCCYDLEDSDDSAESGSDDVCLEENEDCATLDAVKTQVMADKSIWTRPLAHDGII